MSTACRRSGKKPAADLRTTWGYRLILRHERLDMRQYLLDIERAPNGRSPQATTMLRMDVQPRNRAGSTQQNGQLQLCVPLVALKGDSYRLRDRDLGRVPTATTDEP